MDDRWSIATDAELVIRSRTERDAFGALYDRYVTAVYHYCLRRAGSPAEAEDLTSAIFVRVLERLEEVRPESFRGWLFTVARTVVADRFRRTPSVQPLTDEEAEATPDGGDGPEVAALHVEAEGTVTELLRSLPTDQRTALALRLAGLDNREIAAAMDRSVAATKMLHHRASRRLRRVLEGSPACNQRNEQ
jgi:RNA polymerase sigma-70 factor (ECF subfamily)